MKSRFFVRLTMIVLIVFTSTSVLGQSEPAATLLSTTFTYQGYLEQSAIPYTGTCDMEFSLYDDPAAGTQVGSTLTRTNIAVDGGIFNVPLNFGAAVFNGQDRYLSVSVRCPAGAGVYTPLTPRQAINPAPMAMYASNGGGSSIGDAWGLTGNLGTNPAANFIGTIDDQPLEFRVNNSRVMRFEPHAISPNVIGGFSGNSVTAGVYGAVIGGGGDTGLINMVTDNGGVVVGGHNNQAGDNAGTISDRFGAVVVGGSSNRAEGFESFVGGGQGNVVTGIRSVIVGGGFNSVQGTATVVVGGGGNSGGGEYSTIPGGRNNQTNANYAFAAGRRAIANQTGAFVWGDSTDTNVVSPAADSFTVRASGGTIFYSNADMTTGVQLPAGGGAWAALSDQNVKENLALIDPSEVLESLIAMPVSTWNYISQDDSIRHIGVMAQDFYAAFGVGEDDRHISTIDADGVAFAAIQGLYNIIQEQADKLAEQETTIAALQAQNAQFEARLSALEGLAQPQSGSLLPWALAALGCGVSLRLATSLRARHQRRQTGDMG